MAEPSPQQILRRIRLVLAFFIFCLVLSGITAFALQWELELLASWLGVPAAASPESYSGLTWWIVIVRNGLQETYAKYPFIAYGTDWLAFAHVILAVLFVGAWRDPVRNAWVIDFGLWACVLVIPLALICGHIRGIPFGWRLIDCSFGVFGLIPLCWIRKWTCELATGTAELSDV
ncbi:MAG TPA: hypothetical protein VGP72_07605 [Planctomycetota bacterium]|jgi:hypothetical protein